MPGKIDETGRHAMVLGYMQTQNDTSMAIDWTLIFEKYKGLWVALKDDEQTVVGSGKTLQEALEEASKNGYDEPIVTRMPEELRTFIGPLPCYSHI
jgi:Family of unknown function (DUF5678)